MKEIEKLADDYVSKPVTPEQMRPDYRHEFEAFIVGFKKAREMALRIHETCGAASGCCSHKIQFLGESEVPEDHR